MCVVYFSVTMHLNLSDGISYASLTYILHSYKNLTDVQISQIYFCLFALVTLTFPVFPPFLFILDFSFFFQASLNITFSMIFLFIVAQKRVFSLNIQLTSLNALNYQCLRYDLLRNKDKIISLILFHKIY